TIGNKSGISRSSPGITRQRAFWFVAAHLPTGTTFGAGRASASNDPVTHNTTEPSKSLRATPGYHRGYGCGSDHGSKSVRVLSSIGRPSGPLIREKVVHNLPGAACSAGRPRSAPRPPKSHAAINRQRGPAQFALRLVGVDHEQE